MIVVAGTLAESSPTIGRLVVVGSRMVTADGDQRC
jgi:hypothetical protein